ncbi:oligosaccharide flippase family protein [Cytobacillus horneckiae]|uniref:oligosaccharide flippase family protein n=1 Tax=Cytobacillus horneckiae TaxID=549687 RepID=UPI003D9A8E89
MEIDKKSNLLSNTIMLYILVFSTYFFSFISLPYQARILGPEYFGRVGFALALTNFFKLLIDFGFILSATEKVSNNRENKKELSKIVISVNIIKFFLFVSSLIILIIIVQTIPRFKEDALFYILMLISVGITSFLPDFLYRGIEKMRAITVRTVLIQATFVLMLFLFLNEKEDYYLIPILNIIVNLLAIIFIYIHVYKYIGLTYVSVSPQYIWKELKTSSVFFYSRIASTLYSSTNTIFLGLIYPMGNSTVGLYNSVERLVGTAKSLFSPIADSLYPYMIRSKDFKLVRNILIIIIPIVIICCVTVGIYAEDLLAMLFGEQFRSAGYILRVLLPVVVMSPIIYILGFPVLTPMGLSKHANYSIISASIIHLFMLTIVFLMGEFNVIVLCILVVITESLILLYRIIVVWKHRDMFPIKKITSSNPIRRIDVNEK